MSDIAFVTDGTFAVVGLVLGLIDMGANHCTAGGCLARQEVQPHASLSAGATYFQENQVGEELYFRRDVGHTYGPFQPVYGFSATSDGELWGGAGAAYRISDRSDHLYMQFHTMAGLYAEGDGVDLGGPIQFRSGIEFGYQTDRGVRMSLGFDHRSNAGIDSPNPGLETVHFRVSIPTK